MPPTTSKDAALKAAVTIYHTIRTKAAKRAGGPDLIPKERFGATLEFLRSLPPSAGVRVPGFPWFQPASLRRRAGLSVTATLHALGMGRDAGAYYTNDPNREARPHRRDEYYVGGADELGATTGAGGGIWWSSGETIVADGSPVDAEVFRDLCAGLDPRTGDGPNTATSLVRGAGHGHRAGWDMTFSAPKGASLLWAAGDATQRGLIQAAHAQSVESALSFLEREGLVEVRLGAGGARREKPTDLIVARFDHFTSREGDPNLHSHCVIINCAGSADGKYRTLEPKLLMHGKK